PAQTQQSGTDLRQVRYEYWKEQDGKMTAEQDGALEGQLLQYRRQLDGRMQQIQAAASQGQMNQQAFNQARMAYLRNVADVEARWKALQERKAAREGTAPAESAPAPSEPAPAPSEPASAPAEPAPAPAEPAPAPAEPAPAAFDIPSTLLRLVETEV
ncbi:MAG: hypothetical protein IKS14_01370, partial [Thermoguttaceae bacterium]|nr:hypothetical protein [Thermoguttaceae bacterium]